MAGGYYYQRGKARASPSPPQKEERVGVRRLSCLVLAERHKLFSLIPLTPALSPFWRGEGDDADGICVRQSDPRITAGLVGRGTTCAPSW